MTKTQELQKINLIKMIIALHDNKLLNDIENFINSKTNTDTKFAIRTISGKYLTENEYKNRIYTISDEVKNGKYIKHSELLKEIENE